MDSRRPLVVSTAAMRPISAPASPAAAPIAAPVLKRPRLQRIPQPALGQIVCWQIAIVLAALAVRASWLTSVLEAAGAGAFAAAGAVRHRGRWVYQVALLRCRSALRARRHRIPEVGDLVTLLLPRSVMRDAETADGPLATISRVDGLTAILGPQTVTKPLLSSFPAPDVLLAAVDLPSVEVQTVFHVPARRDRPAGVWLAVGVARTAEFATDEDLMPLLRGAVHNVQQALTATGVRTDPVRTDAALGVLSGLTHLGGRQELRQSWRFVHTRGVVPACFLLDGHDRADLQRLLGTLLARYPGVAVTATRAARGDETSTLLRLSATTESAVDAAAADAAHLLSPTGIRLTRLDGVQLSGLAATLPIGGFLR